MVSVLRVQGLGLDRRFLDVWAGKLGVEALLARAWGDQSNA